MILFLLLTLFIIGDVTACSCSNDIQPPLGYQYPWPTFYLQNPFDGNNPCVPASFCTILLNGGEGKGVGNYKQSQWDVNVNGTINLYNSDENRAKKSAIMLGIVRDDSRTVPASTGQYVLVEMALTSAGNVLSTMSSTDATATTTTPAPPTTTTTPYRGPFSKNPALISNDLMIMVDQGLNANNTPTDFANSKAFAAAVVNTIAPSVFGGVATDESPVTGTRLAVNYLNSAGYGGAIDPWIENSTAISQVILGLPLLQSRKTDYQKTMTALLEAPCFFNPANIDTDASRNSRKTAQRILLVVASSAPASNDGIYDNNIQFEKYDIHPIFVAYNFDISTLASLSPKWTLVAVNNASDATVNNFVDTYLLKNSGMEVCPEFGETKFTADNATNNVIKYGFESPPPTLPYQPVYDKNRYCNFQQTSYYVAKRTDNNNSYCFTVFYELEVEKDTLKFFQCNNGTCSEGGKYIEYVSLSGTDVSGSKFCFTNSTRIDFSTNESVIYGGYHITINKT